MYYRPVQSINLRQHDVRVNWTEDELKAQRARRILVPWAQKRLAVLETKSFLLPEDRLALIYLSTALMAQEYLWEPGKRIMEADFDRTLVTASHVLLDIVDPGVPHVFDVIPFTDWVLAQFDGLDSARTRACSGTGTRRDIFIDGYWILAWTHFAPERDGKQFCKLAAYYAQRTGALDKRAVATDEILHGALLLYRKLTGGAPGGIRRNLKGQIELLPTQLRDFFCSTMGGKRIRARTTPVLASDGSRPAEVFKPVAVRMDDVAPICAPDEGVVESVGAVEQVRQVEALIQARAAKCKAGSVMERVLPFAIPIFKGEISAVEVAHRLGCSQSAVSKALEAHRQAVLVGTKSSRDL